MDFLDRLRANCRQYADKPALELPGNGSGKTITYRQLEEIVLQTMSYLRAKGVQRGDRVALQLPKCLPFVYLHLATMHLGAISLPLNPGYTARELSYFLQDAGARLLFTGAAMREGLGALPEGWPPVEEVVSLDADTHESFQALITGSGSGEAGGTGDPTSPGEGETCLMIYTSGTTGWPKGAELTHGNLTATLNSLHEAWGWRADDVLLHILPLFHVHGLIVALHGALNAGAATVLLTQFDPKTTLQVLRDRQCTILMAVPAILRRLVDVPGAETYDLDHVRLITSGSDRLPDDLFKRFRATFGHTPLERYGMSETGMLISNPLNGERRAGSVGLPLPGVAVRIVDPVTEEPLPDNEVGAVQVRGPNVFKGYWRQPQKTAAAFTTDGWFRTGDLGLREPDGYFTLKGRSRDLIITGGYNVYPAEVEVVLAAHPAVQACAVVGCPSEAWGESVIAFVILHPDAEVTPDELIIHCRSSLVSYKVPRRVIFVKDLPRNSLGKVQRARLRQELCSQDGPDR